MKTTGSNGWRVGRVLPRIPRVSVGTLLLYAALAGGAFLCCWPFFWMLSTSLETFQEAMAPGLSIWPASWHWENYVETWRSSPFPRYFLNTFLVAGTVAVAVTTSAALAGYALVFLRFPGRRLAFLVSLGAMMVPFEAVFIPNFVLIARLGWYNTFAALIIPWCANGFSIFLMRQAFLGIPSDYYEAARLDGCGPARFLFRVALPLVRPTLSVTAVFAFLGSYNALLWPLVVTADGSRRVVQVGLTVFTTESGVQLHLLMCAATIVMLPSVLLFLLAQRAVSETMLATGVKG
ncbi:MAG TPA: carbohydrate ABC transporter permease [Candidatus Hydrogenedentes bacterium]|nr:carbohydrate ABC transporter permease [Candidatus Hydrogenedentota bacterium]